MMLAKKIIYAIPGLGCTADLFTFIKVEGYVIKVLDWPSVTTSHSMKDYAKAFLAQLDLDKPIYLMGVSLGGMLCAELSELVSTQKVVLISSCQQRHELPWVIRLWKYLPLYKLLPNSIILHLGLVFRVRLGFSKADAPVLKAMFKSMPISYFRKTVGFIINWERTTLPTKVIRIHGLNDKILWVNCLTNVTFEIPKGGHAIVYTDFEKVNGCLEKIFNER